MGNLTTETTREICKDRKRTTPADDIQYHSAGGFFYLIVIPRKRALPALYKALK